MAPAQIMDIPESPAHYTHKKFQGKQQQHYAHKKFGTRLAEEQLKLQFPNKTTEIIDNHSTTTKKSSGNLFRPYDLPDNTPRKRKHHEIQDVDEEQQCSATTSVEFKRFAVPSPIISPTVHMTSYTPQFATSFNTTTASFWNPPYQPQNYQFNSQTFALVLQKQQAALCMGEMLKRQANFNLYNIKG